MKKSSGYDEIRKIFYIKEDVCTDGWVVHLDDLSVQGKQDKLKC